MSRLATSHVGPREWDAEVYHRVSRPSPFAEHLSGMEGIWNFSSARDAEKRLRAAGFEEVECWLEEKLVTGEDSFDYLTTATLGPHLARLPESHARPFAEAVAERMPSPLTLEYVRLNIDARRR